MLWLLGELARMKNARPDSVTPWPSELKPLIDEALDRFLPAEKRQPEPLHRAMRYAVFSSGKRLRPQLLLKVAQAAGLPAHDLDLALRAACAIELIHVASLVHDDLPCFDDAALRRGRPTVHAVFGEARALLVGDALLARSFELLATGPRKEAARALRVVQLLACATGSLSGLVGGQELEHEQASALGPNPRVPESAASYHEMKTGALFGMAAEAAAVVAGSKKSAAWAAVGRLVGKGYQMAYAMTSMPHSEQVDIVLQSQLSDLSDTLHALIADLADTPEPLLAFLDELCSPLLRPQTRSYVPESAARNSSPDPTLERQAP